MQDTRRHRDYEVLGRNPEAVALPHYGSASDDDCDIYLTGNRPKVQRNAMFTCCFFFTYSGIFYLQGSHYSNPYAVFMTLTLAPYIHADMEMFRT